MAKAKQTTCAEEIVDRTILRLETAADQMSKIDSTKASATFNYNDAKRDLSEVNLFVDIEKGEVVIGVDGTLIVDEKAQVELASKLHKAVHKRANDLIAQKKREAIDKL